MKQRFDPSYLLLVFPVLRMSMPWLQYRTRAILVVPFLLLWFLWQIVTPVRNVPPGRAALARSFFWTFGLMLFYMLLQKIYGFEVNAIRRVGFSWYGFLSNVVMNISFLGIVYCSFIHNRFKELKLIGLLLVLVMLFQGAMSLLHGSEIEGGAARLVVGMQQTGWMSDKSSVMDEASVVLENGLGGYHLIYIYAFLTPAFLYAAYRIKNRKIKALCIVVAVANLISIMQGGLQTPIFVVFLGFLFCVAAIVVRARKSLVIFGIVAGVLLIVFVKYPIVFRPLAAPLELAAEMTERGVYKGRLLSLAAAVRGDTRTYAIDRYYLQLQSIDSFLSGNILIGEGPNAHEGGHSMFLDMLAYYGLFGLVVFIAFLASYLNFMKNLGKMYLGRQWLAMVYCYLGAFLFTTVANPVSLCYGEMYIMFPVLALFFPDCPVNEENYRKVLV